MSKKKRKLTPKNEFRYNYSTKHKNYIFAETDKRYIGLGLTHNEKTFGKKNMPLEKNPQNGKTDKAYIRNGYVVDSKNKFDKEVLKNYCFEKNDFINVKSKVRYYKKKNK